MKNLKKKIAALGLAVATVASSVMSVSASAWEAVDWPGVHNAYTGQFFATSTSVGVSNLRWNSSQISDFGILQVVEFEYHPRLSGSVVSKNDIWTTESSHSSNLPKVYTECQSDDPNDVAVCCGNPKGLVAGDSYYGTMYLVRNTSFIPQSWPYTFSVELAVGHSSLGDYLPLKEAYYNDGSDNVVFGQTYTW